MKAKSFINRCVLALALVSMAGLFQTLKAAQDPNTWPPIVHVVAADPDAAEEGADPAIFQIFRIGASDTALTVFFQIGGTATYGIDYNLLAPDSASLGVVTNSAERLFSVAFAPGQLLLPITVAPIDDYEVERWEHVVLAIQQPAIWPPPYIVDWPSVAAAWIEDNDPAPTNQPPRVAIINPPDGAVFVGVESIPLVARASDPDDRVATVEFFDGTTSLGIVTNRLWPTVSSNDDPEATTDPALRVDAELLPDPTLDSIAQISPIPLNLFRLVWENPSPGRHALTAVATDTRGARTASDAVILFVVEHPQPVVTVKATDPEATEPTPDGTHLDTAKFTIHRTGPTNFPLTVWYKLGGRASNSLDYAELASNILIPEGARTADVLIEPLGDNLVEGDESVVLTIAPPICIDIFPPPADCYAVGDPNSARAVIHDANVPNRPPIVRIVRPLDGSVFLAPADIPIVAQPYDPDGRWVSVEFFAGTNSLGIVSNSVLPVLPMVVWSNVPPGRYVLTAVATDNDGARGHSYPVDIKVVHRPMPPEVNIVATDAIATEPTMLPIDTASFTVSRTGSTSNSLVVFYRIGGTASNGVDYRSLPNRMLIPEGAASAEIVVAPFADNLVEGPESVVLSLQYPPYDSALRVADYYMLGSNNAARAVIRDSNVAPSNLPPRVAIVSPREGDLFDAFVAIPICAAACDPDGFVRTVEFFEGTNSLGVVSNNVSSGTGNGGTPTIADADQLFHLVWRNVPPGRYELTALATDNKGASSKSDPVHIKVADIQLLPVVTIYATDPRASEGPIMMTNIIILGGGEPTDPRMSNLVDVAKFTVRRSGRTNTDLTIFYALRGTAENGVDYRSLPGQVTIPRGAYSADIIVAPIDDRLVEGTETVIATLQPIACPAIYPPPATCYTVGDPNSATAYILDNDFNQSPKVEIVQPNEGEFFLAPADIKINVVACDPNGRVGKVEFYAGTKLIGEQEIYFFVPPPPGQVQTFSLVWSNVPAGSYVLTARAFDDQGAGKISDPVRIGVLETIPIPIVTIVASDPNATEPNPLSMTPVLDTATFTVKRVGDLSQSLRVFYRVSGTASNGVDYRLLSGAVEIPENSATADIVVAPMDDKLVEGIESVIVALEQLRCVTTNLPPPEGCYIVGQSGRAAAYIRDNDLPPNEPPSVALISPANGAVFTAPANIRLVASAKDPDGWVATVEFFADGASLGIVSNDIWTVEPVRLPELDGALLSGPSVTPSLPIIAPFVLNWSNVPPGQHVLTAVATDNLGAKARSLPVQITVLEHQHVPVVTIMAIDSIAREGTTNTAIFRVRRTGSTNESLTVMYSIRGTALNGVDYATIPNIITIPAGRRSARIVITPMDDRIRELIETVILRLQPSPLDVYPPPYVVGRPACAAAIILDNDCPRPATRTLPDGNLLVRLPMSNGLPYRLEASSDLRTWETVADHVVTEEGIDYVEGESNDLGLRFYRVIPEIEPALDD